MAAGSNWSRVEVEATVGSYFEMLRFEIGGIRYNKSAHRRQLKPLLHGRSRAAIERKHQNISAVLIDLGFPFIDGYKPLGNYQELLREVVEERLVEAPELITMVARTVEQEATVPDVDDILAVLVEAPGRPGPGMERYYRERKRPEIATRPNYLLREIRNASLGRAGELFALNFERARLIASGQERLAADVEHVAETRGDHEGFDILSFEVGGGERLIEVKTTSFGRHTPFFVTSNELSVSQREGERYHLYRLFSFRRETALFTVPGSLDNSFELLPAQYQARI